jgi:HAE1 family hydrophobic/amphiphilic exporter-1
MFPLLYRLVEGRGEGKRLLRALHVRPEFAGADDVDAEFSDWTTGMVPKVSGRRAAAGDAE